MLAKLRLLAGIAALWLLCGLAGLALAQPTPAAGLKASRIEVSVTGTARVMPDTAVLSFTVNGRQPTLAAAYRQAGRRAAAVRALLLSHGIPSRQAAFSRYSVAPQTDWPRYHSNKIVGYRVTAFLNLRLSKFAVARKIIAQAARENLTALRSLGFELRHRHAARRLAIQNAYARARAAAGILAVAAGRRLGPLTRARLNFAPAAVPFRYPFHALMAAAPPSAANHAGIAGRFTPARITVQVSLAASFALR